MNSTKKYTLLLRVMQVGNILTWNKLFMAFGLLRLLFLGTSNCFFMGEFSFSNGSLGIISLVLFLKLHP